MMTIIEAANIAENLKETHTDLESLEALALSRLIDHARATASDDDLSKKITELKRENERLTYKSEELAKRLVEDIEPESELLEVQGGISEIAKAASENGFDFSISFYRPDDP